MTSTFYRWFACGLLLLTGQAVHAAVSCSLSSNGFSTAYNPAAALAPVQTSFTLTCTPNAGETSVAYTVSATNGLYALGVNNRAFQGGSYLKYDVYVDAGCGTQWKGASAFTGTLAFSGSTPVSRVISYWGCAQTGQNTLPAGTYSDLVSYTVSWGALSSSSTFPVNIATPSTCSITSAPVNVAFAPYVAFGGALSASSGFGATCTNYLPYTMSVSPTSGTIAALNYTIVLQNASPVMSGTTLSVTGSGVQQNYTIKGDMVGGQAGTCAAGTCSGSVPHTMTLTY